MLAIPADATVAIIGLGYVGLPLAVEFARVRPTIGFDIDAGRIEQLAAGQDRTLEASAAELAAATHLRLTAYPDDLAGADVFIVTVPTPIDAAKRPDLRPLESASRTVGGALRPGGVVIYESTVYPGATEEVCVPILEAESGLRFNTDFYVGYSPERINPGDKVHRLPDILKVTSGSTPEVAEDIDALYRSIITAGTHKAPSIRVAEAAKVIENTQRDVNVALINELAVLFGELGIDTHDVLEAAGTKWNFLRFTPGLVGGHCIGVDPYYLTHKAQEVGHHPEVIMAGRRINDSMGPHVADEVVLLLARAGRPVSGARVLVLGLAFKENCPDVRNTRVVDIVGRLGEYAIAAQVCDPWVDAGEAKAEYGLSLVGLEDALAAQWDAVVLAVAHEQFGDVAPAVRAAASDGVVYDVKGVWPRELVDGRL
ncbi:MAG: nucleotide sugar dehydrogenase [Candidatus Nanopelagicales bacterium]